MILSKTPANIIQNIILAQIIHTNYHNTSEFINIDNHNA